MQEQPQTHTNTTEVSHSTGLKTRRKNQTEEAKQCRAKTGNVHTNILNNKPFFSRTANEHMLSSLIDVCFLVRLKRQFTKKWTVLSFLSKCSYATLHPCVSQYVILNRWSSIPILKNANTEDIHESTQKCSWYRGCSKCRLKKKQTIKNPSKCCG